MYEFFLQIFIMVSLGAMIFLAAKALPRISDAETNEIRPKANWLKYFSSEKADIVFNAFMLKTLRKVKLILMKTDNMVSKQLRKFKNGESADSGNGLSK